MADGGGKPPSCCQPATQRVIRSEEYCFSSKSPIYVSLQCSDSPDRYQVPEPFRVCGIWNRHIPGQHARARCHAGVDSLRNQTLQELTRPTIRFGIRNSSSICAGDDYCNSRTSGRCIRHRKTNIRVSVCSSLDRDCLDRGVKRGRQCLPRGPSTIFVHGHYGRSEAAPSLLPVHLLLLLATESQLDWLHNVPNRRCYWNIGTP